MIEYVDIIIYWIIFFTLLISISNNYLNLLRYYVLQVVLILAIFFILYSDNFADDKILLVSFIFAIIFRLIFIPIYINYFIKSFYVKKLKMRITDRIFRIPQIVTFIILILFFSFSYYLSLFVFSKENMIFIVSIFIFLSWMLNFFNHRKLVWDILSFLAMENAIFFFWLLIIDKIPFYIEFGIMIDIVLILLILLILVYNIKKNLWKTFISILNELKE